MRRLFLLLGWVLVYLLCWLPLSNWESPLTRYIFDRDLLIHASMFFFMTWITLFGTRNEPLFNLKRQPHKIVYYIAVPSALITEGGQMFLSYRDASLRDVMANLTGVLLASVIFRYIRK